MTREEAIKVMAKAMFTLSRDAEGEWDAVQSLWEEDATNAYNALLASGWRYVGPDEVIVKKKDVGKVILVSGVRPVIPSPP